MRPPEFLQVDPASLHLPGSRRDGADPVKLQRQLAKHGASIEGMPPPEVKRGSDGELVIYDGVTRTIEGACRRVTHRGRKIMKACEQTRLELLGALAELARIRPEWRLGQTIANLAMTA